MTFRNTLRQLRPWLILALAVWPAVWHVLDFPEDRDDEYPGVQRPTFSRLPPPAYRLAEPGDTIDRIAIYTSSLAIVLAVTGLGGEPETARPLAVGPGRLAGGVLVRGEPRADVRRLARPRLAAIACSTRRPLSCSASLWPRPRSDWPRHRATSDRALATLGGTLEPGTAARCRTGCSSLP